MKRVIWACDYCKKEATTSPIMIEKDTFDFCEDCVQALVEKLRAIPEEPPKRGRKPKEKQEEKQEEKIPDLPSSPTVKMTFDVILPALIERGLDVREGDIATLVELILVENESKLFQNEEQAREFFCEYLRTKMVQKSQMTDVNF